MYLKMDQRNPLHCYSRYSSHILPQKGKIICFESQKYGQKWVQVLNMINHSNANDHLLWSMVLYGCYKCWHYGLKSNLMSRIYNRTIFSFIINKLYIKLIKLTTVFAFLMFPIIHNSFYHFTNHVTYFLLPYSTENMLCFPHFEEEPSKLTSYTNTHPEVSQELPQNHLNGNLGSVRKEETRTQKQENETVKPKQKRQKEGKRKSHVQRYGRNICSNILHIIIKKVLYYKQYEKDILKIIEKYGMEIKLQQFYSKLYFKQNKLKEYVPFDKIIEFYTGHKNKIKEGMKRHSEFCKILRIITHLYLQTEHIPVAINCGKLKKQSKHFHIRQSHKLQSILRGTYKLDYKS